MGFGFQFLPIGGMMTGGTLKRFPYSAT
jgi:hypothetical protein